MSGATWRDLIAVHPACENLVRPMTGEELSDLAADIAANGLVHPIVLWREADGKPEQLLDGRSRLDAMARAARGRGRLPPAVAQHLELVMAYGDPPRDAAAWTLIQADIETRLAEAEDGRGRAAP